MKRCSIKALVCGAFVMGTMSVAVAQNNTQPMSAEHQAALQQIIQLQQQLIEAQSKAQVAAPVANAAPAQLSADQVALIQQLVQQQLAAQAQQGKLPAGAAGGGNLESMAMSIATQALMGGGGGAGMGAGGSLEGMAASLAAQALLGGGSGAGGGGLESMALSAATQALTGGGGLGGGGSLEAMAASVAAQALIAGGTSLVSNLMGGDSSENAATSNLVNVGNPLQAAPAKEESEGSALNTVGKVLFGGGMLGDYLFSDDESKK